MEKKSQEKLKDLAIRILTLKADADINLLKTETQQLFEELCVLDYLSKLPKQEAPVELEVKKPEVNPPLNVDDLPEKTAPDPERFSLFSIEEAIGVDANFEDIFVKKETQIFIQNTIEPVDEPSTLKAKIEAAKQSEIDKLFDEPIKNNPDISTVSNIQAKIHRSLNDKINQQFIAVDLNDRIAFVKHLFDNSQEDFNRVLSQLNSFENEVEAKEFLLTQVKPDYSWEGKELYEARLLFLIERKFM